MNVRTFMRGLILATSMCLTCYPSYAIQLNPGIYGLQGGWEGVDTRPFTIGWSFDLTQASIVNALGVYDSNSDGLIGSFEIGLWDSLQNLLATVSVSGTSNQLESGFRWAEIPSISLAPGDYVVGALGDLDANPFYYSGTFSTASNLTYIEDRQINASTLSYPSSAFPGFYGGSGLYGANVSFAPTSMPVPGPLPILGLSAAFCFSRKLRRRVKTSILPSASD
jgi:hypothetical protein